MVVLSPSFSRTRRGTLSACSTTWWSAWETGWGRWTGTLWVRCFLLPQTVAGRASLNPACLCVSGEPAPGFKHALLQLFLRRDLFKGRKRASQGVSGELIHALCSRGGTHHVLFYHPALPRSDPRIHLNICRCRQIKETRRAVKDSESGVEKMAIGHHIHDRGHVVEKKYNKKTGDKELNQNFHNMDECTAKKHTWNMLLCLLEMLPNVLLTLHPQLKNSHLKTSGSRRCPGFTRPSPRLSWRDRALA